MCWGLCRPFGAKIIQDCAPPTACAVGYSLSALRACPRGNRSTLMCGRACWTTRAAATLLLRVLRAALQQVDGVGQKLDDAFE